MFSKPIKRQFMHKLKFNELTASIVVFDFCKSVCVRVRVCVSTLTCPCVVVQLKPRF